MNTPLIVLSSLAMPMAAPFRQDYYKTNAFNTDSVRQAGGIPIMSSYADPESAEILLSRADGLLLTGGEDVSPERYGEEPLPECGKCNPRRDESDYNLLRAALKLHKPVLCICRGFQLANVFFGGNLYQDLPSQKPGSLTHARYEIYDLPEAHEVTLLPETPLHTLLGEDRIGVNSLHHQGVRTLSPELIPMAMADDGLIESWRHRGDLWIWGTQWHPEMMPDNPHGNAILQEFIRQCR